MAIIRRRSPNDRQSTRRSAGPQRADGWFTTVARPASSEENVPLGEISYHIWFGRTVNDTINTLIYERKIYFNP